MITDIPPPPAIVKPAEEIEKHEAVYLETETATGFPWFLIAAIHYREAGCDMKKTIKSGGLLPDGVSWSVNAGATLNSWKPFLRRKNLWHPIEEGSMSAMLEFAERYNGLGYRKRGIASPYLWAGTSRYVKGKYTADGKFDPEAVDRQLGVAPILKALWTRHVAETNKE
jgi:lysozyme family protein